MADVEELAKLILGENACGIMLNGERVYCDHREVPADVRRDACECHAVAHRLIEAGWMPPPIGHPMQDMHRDTKGVIRFRANLIIKYLLQVGLIDLNALAVMEFSAEDRMQLAQLIGYSVSGFGDLSYVDKKTVERADELAALVK